MKVTLGAFIAALRKEKGLTQRELSEMLSVSDKTVSHWERDETSPDISLLPVIAEIFGITVDELLRGEKEKTERVENSSSQENAETKNTGILYALDIAFNRFKTKNYISVALSVIAVLCGFIGDYFKGSDAGYLFFLAVLVVPILLTALFRGGFNSTLVSPYADKEDLKNYGRKANRITLFNLYLSLACFTLYSARMILFYVTDFMLVLLVFLASGAVIFLCERTARKKELISGTDKLFTIKKTSLLKGFSCLLCAVMLFTVYVSFSAKDRLDFMYEKAEYTLVPVTDFVALMEKEADAPEEIYGNIDAHFEDVDLRPSDKGTEYTFYPDFGTDSSEIAILDPDGDGEITFTYNNLEIARYSYRYEKGFAVYTHAQLIEASKDAAEAYADYTLLHLALCAAAVLISVGIYFLLRKILLKKGKSEKITLKF